MKRVFFIKMTRLLSVIGLGLACRVSAQVTFTEMGEFSVPAANQGVGVDKDHFYAVDNRRIEKYTKDGAFVGEWVDAEDGAMIHLDSAMVRNGKIYAAHSNWRRLPITSSIEIWDARTMKHIDTHSFGRWGPGSFTWLDFHKGYWWGTFANYDRLGPDGLPYGGGKLNTTVAKFDKDWNIIQTWILPPEILDRLENMSNSGGSWGPDGYLYLTPHTPAEVYKVKIPDVGSVVELVEIIPLNIRGQGIAWDRHEKDILYGIIRSTDEEAANGIANKVVVFKANFPEGTQFKNDVEQNEKQDSDKNDVEK
ncbi:MAG: cycloisomerase [Gammaproteobacteria bacterium HGW-Gammaproteobacteria-3]|nr:MAG: cycloisomerase [Gammaproteobacteria bacterium HGW-Gammaproteobacteria-3]